MAKVYYKEGTTVGFLSHRRYPQFCFRFCHESACPPHMASLTSFPCIRMGTPIVQACNQGAQALCTCSRNVTPLSKLDRFWSERQQYIPDMAHSIVLFWSPAGSSIMNRQQRQGATSHRPTAVGNRILDRNRFPSRQKPTAGIVDSSR